MNPIMNFGLWMQPGAFGKKLNYIHLPAPIGPRRGPEKSHHRLRWPKRACISVSSFFNTGQTFGGFLPGRKVAFTENGHTVGLG